MKNLSQPLNLSGKIIFSCLLFFFVASMPLLATPVITIIGDNPLTHDVNTTYTDLGATAVDGNNNDITSLITVQIGVRVDIPGVYQVKYSVTDGLGNTANAIRMVLVSDRIAPVINGPATIVVCLNDFSFTEPTVSVTDNYYPTVNLTRTGSFDITVVGQYPITYTATDASGNTNVLVRTISVVDCTQTTGVAEVQKTSLGVYPNPSNGIFEVIFTGESCGRLTITDIQGRTVHSMEAATLNSGRTPINISEMPAGLYFVNFHNTTVKIAIVK
ncbi:MAG: DUF5011 domain-containing protein [Bacteroidetes bacterium]|nr:MAG: DUF5011 domain-containing protein [Bacteroidota bacterium]